MNKQCLPICLGVERDREMFLGAYMKCKSSILFHIDSHAIIHMDWKTMRNRIGHLLLIIAI